MTTSFLPLDDRRQLHGGGARQSSLLFIGSLPRLVLNANTKPNTVGGHHLAVEIQGHELLQEHVLGDELAVDNALKPGGLADDGPVAGLDGRTPERKGRLQSR